MLQKRIDDQPSISREMVREAQEILHRHLKRVGLKQTAQRDTILRSFLETRDHLSTDELHRLVQKKMQVLAIPRFIALSSCWRSVGLPAKSPFTMALPVTNTSTTGAVITTWSAPSAAVPWNSFPVKWINWNRRLDVDTTTPPRATHFRSMAFAKTAARFNCT